MAGCEPAKKNIADYFYIMFCGMCMGAADIVPGISGGTIAFIMGFYSDLLNSIKSLKIKNFLFNPSTKFLACLVTGIALSLILLAPLFDRILNHEVSRTYLYSGFFGLILASIVLCFKQIDKWRPSYFLYLAVGCVLAFVLTSVNLKPVSNEALYDVHFPYFTEKVIQNYHSDTENLQNIPEANVVAMIAKGIITEETKLYNKSQNTFVKASSFLLKETRLISFDPWLIFCGSVAVSALLLPGISGSYLLTILGTYSVVIGALADFIEGAKKYNFEADAFSVLLSLSVGILIGAIVFSRVVLWLLKYYRNRTIVLMTGFMIGAMQTVWPFWSYTYFLNPLKLNKGVLLNPDLPFLPVISSSLIIPTLLTILGFTLVFAVEYLANYKGHKKKSPITT